MLDLGQGLVHIRSVDGFIVEASSGLDWWILVLRLRVLASKWRLLILLRWLPWFRLPLSWLIRLHLSWRLRMHLPRWLRLHLRLLIQLLLLGLLLGLLPFQPLLLHHLDQILLHVILHFVCNHLHDGSVFLFLLLGVWIDLLLLFLLNDRSSHF